MTKEWVRPVNYINGKLKVKIPREVEWNQCPTCGELFNSIFAFDWHRTGQFGKDRRCLTIDEMKAKKMAKNRYDRWVSSSFEDSGEHYNKKKQDGQGVDI
jgi:hypothetical protein